MNDDQKATLWIGAFRYYCGRMTYAVSDFCDLLVKEWPDLPERVRALIYKELTEEFVRDDEQRAEDEEMKQTGRYFRAPGHDCDREQWERVRALWKAPTPEVTRRGT